jgi:hypothetical protein
VRLAGANLGDGHAVTRHKAQGATVDIALVYGSSHSHPRSRLCRTFPRPHCQPALRRPTLRRRARRGDRGPYLDALDLDRLAAKLAMRRSQALAVDKLPCA